MAAIPPERRPVHLLNRLAYGPRPGDMERLAEMGVDEYITQQLAPANIPLPANLEAQLASFETLRMTPVALFIRYKPPEPRNVTPELIKQYNKRSQVIMTEAMRARFARALLSPRQLYETMVDFWFNHFNVFAGKGLCRLWTGAYEEQAIRPHAMGGFRELLGATAKHPAMLFYLDNWQNTAPGSPGAKGKEDGLNENYGRELMELHTLGVDGGYTEQDVIALARILTGWGLPPKRQAGGPGAGIRRLFRANPAGAQTMQIMQTGFYFDRDRHDFGDKVLLGRTIKGSGINEGEEALDILAASPATAHHIAFQLAQLFVADNPPDSLVRKLAQRYLASGGDISAILRALFASEEFWDERYYGAKFKTPYQYVVSAVRATGVPATNVRPLYGTAAQLGQPLYGCLTPDGYKNTQDAWLNPDAMMRRLSFATALGAGRLPINQPFVDPGEAVPDPTKRAAVKLASAGGSGMDPPDYPYKLAQTLGNLFTHHTAATVEQADPRMRAALVLGSPEFMRR